MGRQDSERKVLLVGLDGATFDLILPWATDGTLPCFARLLAGGAHAPLRSTIPPVTPLAWSSFITGTNPGQHGIYGFVSRKPGTYDWYATSASSRHGIPLWSWAGNHGRKVGVFNMPMTYPPEPPPCGYMVSGLGVPDVDVEFALPQELQRDLLPRFRPEQLVEQPVSLYNADSFIDYLLQTVDDNLSITHYLMARYPDTSLLCSVFTATDRVQHFYWRQMEDPDAPARQRRAIEQVYRRVDKALASLISEYPDRTLIIMSDHGAGPYRHLIGMNQWLEQKGWLRWCEPSHDLKSRAWGGGRRLYHHLGHRLPGAVRRPLKRILPESLMSKARSEMSHWTLPIIWPETWAYSAGFGGNIYLNLRGREPDGQVEPGWQAERLLGDIAAALHELSDPVTDERVVDKVYRSAELYHGDQLDSAPDLVVTWRDGYYSMAGMGGPGSPIFQGNLRWPDSEASHTAEHRLHGVLIACGPNVLGGVDMEEVNIIDLAPTLLHLLGLPIPSTMEGRVLTELLNLSELGQPRFEKASSQIEADWTSAYSEEEEQVIQQRLQDLGYLD